MNDCSSMYPVNYQSVHQSHHTSTNQLHYQGPLPQKQHRLLLIASSPHRLTYCTMHSHIALQPHHVTPSVLKFAPSLQKTTLYCIRLKFANTAALYCSTIPPPATSPFVIPFLQILPHHLTTITPTIQLS